MGKPKNETRILAACASIITAGFLVCVTIISSHRRSELLLPWYDVASTGDGISPEVVNYWRVPPQYTTGSLGAVQQDVTKWNGDHALNGGNKEWAEEDGALHAYNMANWRIKVLESQIQKQKLQWKLMHGQDNCKDGSCGHKKNSEPQTLSSDQNEIKELEEVVAMQSEQIDGLEKELQTNKPAEESHSAAATTDDVVKDVVKELDTVSSSIKGESKDKSVKSGQSSEPKQLRIDADAVESNNQDDADKFSSDEGAKELQADDGGSSSADSSSSDTDSSDNSN